MLIRRLNRQGRLYHLSNDADVKQTRISSMGNGKFIIVNHPLEVLDQAWFYWNAGHHIQESFHMLSASEREFLLTGITGEEWNTIFKEE